MRIVYQMVFFLNSTFSFSCRLVNTSSPVMGRGMGVKATARYSICSFLILQLQQPRRPRSIVHSTFFWTCLNSSWLCPWVSERTYTSSSPLTLPPFPVRKDYSKEIWDRVCPVLLFESLVWTRLSLYFGCISAEKPRNIMLRKGLVSLRATCSLKKPVSICFWLF